MRRWLGARLRGRRKPDDASNDVRLLGDVLGFCGHRPGYLGLRCNRPAGHAGPHCESSGTGWVEWSRR